MQSLPTQAEMFSNTRESLQAARGGLSDARDWLNSDWAPIGSSLPDIAADARISVRRKIAEAKALIDEATNELDAVHEHYRQKGATY